MQNVDLVKPPERLRSSGNANQRCRAVDLAVMDDLEPVNVAETGQQLARPSPEWARPRSDLAQHGDRENTTVFQPTDHCLIEGASGEQMAHDEIDLRSRGQSGIEITHLESAPVADTVGCRQLSGVADGHVRTINTVDSETT